MNIGVISLGLIGGSIVKSLQNKHDIYAVTSNDNTICECQKYTKKQSKSLDILKDCDMVFVASPIFLTNEVLDNLENIVSKNCIVLDCASVKQEIMKKQRPYKFIGSHPMAGKEISGFKSATDDLFKGCKWVFCPQDNVTNQDLQTAKSVIKQMGANIIITSAKEHDEATALISHMPLFLSQALLNAVKENELALNLASSGFRDMTRICMSNLGMALDMRTFNAEHIDIALDKLLLSINDLRHSTDREKLEELKNLRQQMYSPEGKNIFNTKISND